jgi:hypothetical protein
MPNYMIPFVPIIHESEKPFAMFKDLKEKYGEWVLDVLKYDSTDNLLAVFNDAVVRPALEKATRKNNAWSRSSKCDGVSPVRIIFSRCGRWRQQAHDCCRYLPRFGSDEPDILRTFVSSPTRAKLLGRSARTSQAHDCKSKQEDVAWLVGSL